MEDEIGTVVVDAEFADGGGYVLERGGLYTLSLYGEVGTSGNYAFTLKRVSAPVVVEPHAETPIAVTIGEVNTGDLTQTDGVNMYTFTATAGQIVAVEVTAIAPTLADLTWRLKDPTGNTVGAAPLGEEMTFPLAVDGVYTLLVYSETDLTGAYQFRAVEQRIEQDRLIPTQE